jgi:hypothetical protein
LYMSFWWRKYQGSKVKQAFTLFSRKATLAAVIPPNE